MNNIVVTLKSNVAHDEEGNILLDSDGDLILTNDEDVGIISKTHCIPMSSVDKEGNLIGNVVALVEVYWEIRRNPAPAMVDPSTLVWLSIVGEDQDEQDDETDDTDSTTEGGEEIDAEYEEAN